MPRLSPFLEQAAFFLYGRDPGSGEWVGPLGSGVVVGCHSFQTPITWSYYAVTARHVIRSGAHAIRVNTRDQKSRLIEIEIDEWRSRPGEDVAAVDITDKMERADAISADAISYVSFDQFVTEDFAAGAGLGPGEDGFMLGLFSAHPGQHRNRVAARFGNLSLLARTDAPITRKDRGTGDTYISACHVFDIHSRPGYSGSPVFVYRTPETDLRDIENRSPGWRTRVRTPHHFDERDDELEVEIIDESSRDNRFLRLLGIHANQFHDEVEVSKKSRARAKSEDAVVQEGDSIGFPGSMTIVVPAWEIMKLIGEDIVLENEREKRLQRRSGKSGDTILNS